MKNKAITNLGKKTLGTKVVGQWKLTANYFDLEVDNIYIIKTLNC